MISFELQSIIDLLKLGDIFEIKRGLYNLSENKSFQESEIDLNEEIHKTIEINYYYTLSALLEARQFEYFKLLLELSANLNIFIDAAKIPDRFGLLSIIQLEGIT